MQIANFQNNLRKFSKQLCGELSKMPYNLRNSSIGICTLTHHMLKEYSSGQSHFSEINAKLAEENEFVTHFVQKRLETRENEQNVV